MINDDTPLAQREVVYVEGERAFQEGKWRSCNPYTASSSILEQVWINGWDHGRRLNQLEERSLPNAI